MAAATALRLARDGYATAVVAPASPTPGAATVASGAMLGALGEVGAALAPRSPLDLDLRMQAASAYGGWMAELGVPASALRRGTFVLAAVGHRSDLRALAAIEAVARERGLRCERVEARDVPGLAPSRGQAPERVLFLPDEGWVDAPRLLDAVLDAAAATGRVDRIETRVTAVLERERTVEGIVTEGEGRIEAPVVVLCAGTEVTPLLEASGLGDVMPPLLRAKGVSLCLRRSVRPLGGPPLTHVIRTPNREFACGLHVIPRAEEIYLGSTNRLSRWEGMTGEVTAGEITALLRSGARELLADLPTWNVARMMFGYRPLAADGLPIVGGTEVDGLFVATGTYRNGILLAPVLAGVVADEIAGEEGYDPLSPRRGRRQVVTRRAPEVLAEGLREFAQLVRNADDPPLQPTLESLLSTLGLLALDDSASSASLRRRLRVVLDAYPLLELVPELAIEMCNPELFD